MRWGAVIRSKVRALYPLRIVPEVTCLQAVTEFDPFVMGRILCRFPVSWNLYGEMVGGGILVSLSASYFCLVCFFKIYLRAQCFQACGAVGLPLKRWYVVIRWVRRFGGG